MTLSAGAENTVTLIQRPITEVRNISIGCNVVVELMDGRNLLNVLDELICPMYNHEAGRDARRDVEEGWARHYSCRHYPFRALIERQAPQLDDFMDTSREYGVYLNRQYSCNRHFP